MARSAQTTKTVLRGHTAPDFAAAQNAGARVLMKGVVPQFINGMAIQVKTQEKFLDILVAPSENTLDNDAQQNVPQIKIPLDFHTF